jgi:transcriptional regulator with XRE-family HTH domain
MVRRRRLAAELRRLREAAQLTGEQVAAILEFSASKISRIETGRVSVSPRDVRDLLMVYGVPEEERASLIQLARDSRQKGWWQAYADLQPHQATYLGLEHDASEIRIYKISRVHALLQTDDYARAIFSAGAGKVQSVAPLLERQRQARASHCRLWVVQDEASLRNQVAGREVQRDQLEHLLELTDIADIFLQVLPFTSGVHMTMDTSFTIMSFPDPADPDVVCLWYPTGVLWVEDQAEVSQYNALFRRLQAAAPSFEDSAALITSVLKDL